MFCWSGKIREIYFLKDATFSEKKRGNESFIYMHHLCNHVPTKLTAPVPQRRSDLYQAGIDFIYTSTAETGMIYFYLIILNLAY